MTQLTIGGLLDLLRKANQTDPWTGGDSVDSYRGYYDELAIEPGGTATVADAVAMLEESIGATFEGYKGGDYTMYGHTPVWSAPYGSTGAPVTGITITAGGIGLATGPDTW